VLTVPALSEQGSALSPSSQFKRAMFRRRYRRWRVRFGCVFADWPSPCLVSTGSARFGVGSVGHGAAWLRAAATIAAWVRDRCDGSGRPGCL